MSEPIVLHDDQGRRMFAFDPKTDPDAVLHAVAWAHPQGIPMCGIDPHSGYCVDCHGIAYAALVEARRRLG